MTQPRKTLLQKTRRALFITAYSLILLLFLTLTTLWLRSYFTSDELSRGWYTLWPDTTSLSTPPGATVSHDHSGNFSIFWNRGRLFLNFSHWELLHIPPPPPPTPAPLPPSPPTPLTFIPTVTVWSFDHRPAFPSPPKPHFHSAILNPDWTPNEEFNSFPQPPTSWSKGYNHTFTAPFWLLTLPLLLLTSLPLVRFLPHFRRKRRLSQGLCPNCAYDLRASKDRCPECGHPIHPQRPPRMNSAH